MLKIGLTLLMLVGLTYAAKEKSEPCDPLKDLAANEEDLPPATLPFIRSAPPVRRQAMKVVHRRPKPKAKPKPDQSPVLLSFAEAAARKEKPKIDALRKWTGLVEIRSGRKIIRGKILAIADPTTIDGAPTITVQPTKANAAPVSVNYREIQKIDLLPLAP